VPDAHCCDTLHGVKKNCFAKQNVGFSMKKRLQERDVICVECGLIPMHANAEIKMQRKDWNVMTSMELKVAFDFFLF